MGNQKKSGLDKSANVQKLLLTLYILCAALLLTDLFYHKHAIIKLEEAFGFFGIYGFVACVILVLVAKEMRRLVGRPEGYYEDNDNA